MADGKPAASVGLDLHHVEPIAESVRAVARDLPAGDTLDLTPFPSGDGLDRSAVVVRSPSLDLDEGDQRTAPHDQIEFLAAEAYVALHHLPPPILQPLCCRVLEAPAEPMRVHIAGWMAARGGDRAILGPSGS